MFWQESEEQRTPTAPVDVVDVAFRIRCPTLPLEHAYALSAALLSALTWLDDEPDAGIHAVHGAASGNGWFRPEGDTEILHLPKRTRLYLRLPRRRLHDASALHGKTLDISGHPMAVGNSSVRALGTTPTLFARHIALTTKDDDEEKFTSQIAGQLGEVGVTVRKLLCGKPHVIATPHGGIRTRSVMLAELDPEDSITLQQRGLGPHRKLGCGLFIPHKGIAALVAPD